MPADRQHADRLLDKLAPDQLAALVHLLETMVPSEEDRDTLSPAERQAVAEADAWLQSNRAITHEEVLAEIGLTAADWEAMGQGPQEDTPRRNG